MNASDRIQQIHERALRVSATHRTSEIELISILQEMDQCRGYLHFEATSLFDYSHRILRLSEATSMNLINVARKSVEVPELKQAIEQGVLSVSKARKIVPVLTTENKNVWIALATKNTSREIERAVAKENPQFSVRESARFVSGDRLELKLGLSDENYQKLKRVCDLESQKISKAVNQEGAITAALEAYLQKYDPIRIAERSLKRRAGTSMELSDRAPSSLRGEAKHVTGHAVNSMKRLTAQASSVATSKFPFSVNALAVRGVRRALPRVLVHQLHLRDGGQCTYRSSDGARCASRRWLEFHHICPRELGGADTLENLKTLCSLHHSVIHKGL